MKKRSRQEISEIMRKVASRDTIPEQTFRKAVWKRGYRYRVSPARLIGKPDVVFPSRRVAVFIDGDYWHGHQWRNRKLKSLEAQFSNSETSSYWIEKIRRNMYRDCRVTSQLLNEGWTVLRFWESEVKSNLEDCIEATINALEDRAVEGPGSLLADRTFAEFFAGIGLMRMGLEAAGWTIKFANDNDHQKVEMYRGNFPDADEHCVLEDVHLVDPSTVPDVTLATASFPCNDLSLAGSRAGLNGGQSSAFWGFVEILRSKGERRPPLVLLENVTGFLSSHKGKDFETACLALNDLGYDVDAFILDAARFVPQSRQRLFIIGVRRAVSKSSGIAREASRFYESAVRPTALADYIFCHPNIRWNIRDLPAPPVLTTTLEDILEDMSHGSPEWWSPARAQYLLDQMSPKHRAVADGMIKKRKWSYGTVFRRVRHGKSMAELRTDGIAGCLRTPRGGSGRQILVKAGYSQFHVRLLTPRECARLMGANEYAIEASLNQALFGFGDAVCVPVIEWIAVHYLNPVINESLRGEALLHSRNGR